LIAILGWVDWIERLRAAVLYAAVGTLILRYFAVLWKGA
jgi:hypothetical protein